MMFMEMGQFVSRRDYCDFLVLYILRARILYFTIILEVINPFATAVHAPLK